MPDRVVVFVRHRVIGVVPVHPVAEPDRLVGLALGKAADTLLASLDEFRDAERFDVAFAFETELFLNLDLDPESLTIEPVLEALFFAEHRLVPLKKVLIGAPPGMMDAHRIVGRDWAVKERVTFMRLVVLLQVLRDDAVALPPIEKLTLLRREIDFGSDLFERGHGAAPVHARFASNKKPVLNRGRANPRYHLDWPAHVRPTRATPG